MVGRRLNRRSNGSPAVPRGGHGGTASATMSRRERAPNACGRPRDARCPARRRALAVPTMPATCGVPNPVENSSAGGFQVATPDNPVTLPTVGESIPDRRTSRETGATLQIYNWDAYMWKRVIQRVLSDQYDCDYDWTTFENMETASPSSSGPAEVRRVLPGPLDQLGKLVIAKLILAAQPRSSSRTSQRTPGPSSRTPSTTREGSTPSVHDLHDGHRVSTDQISDDESESTPIRTSILWDPDTRARSASTTTTARRSAMGLMKNGIKDINTGDPTDINKAKEGLLKLIDAVNVAVRSTACTRRSRRRVLGRTVWSGDMVGGLVLPAQGESRRRPRVLVPTGRSVA